MKKHFKIFGLVAAVVLFLFVLAKNGGWFVQNYSPIEETLGQQVNKTENSTNPNAAQIAGVGGEPAKAILEQYDTEPLELIRQILELPKEGLFEHYPVDEAFLSWVAGQYEGDFLAQFIDCVKKADVGENPWYQMTGKTMHVLWMEYCNSIGYGTEQFENVHMIETKQKGKVKIDLIGDINFDKDWCTMETAERALGVEYCISESIQKELQDADLTVVNNEFVYSNRGEPIEGKSYTFRADPEDVKYLELFGADIVSLANNHVFDYGEDAFLDTLDTLKEAGYVTLGGGRDLEEASAIHYYIAAGRKIAFVAATEIERTYHYTRMAGENLPGVLKTQQSETLSKTMRTAAQNSDYAIAYIHWGGEGNNFNEMDQDEIAAKLVENGADAVIGGHPHRLQGATFMDGVPVAYSLGNFWFSTGSLYTTIAQIQIDEKGKLTLGFLPCVQRGVKTRMLEMKPEIDDFYHYFADVSENIGIDENGCIYSLEEEGVQSYAYYSEEAYGLWHNRMDLDGVRIDIVGNRVE